MRDVTLVIVSPLPGMLQSLDRIVLTQKFVDGVLLFRKLWEGPVLHICKPATTLSDNLDNIEVNLREPEFETVCCDLSESSLARVIPSKAVVLVSVGEQFNHVSRVCRARSIPCVYIAEYSLQTRLQIVEEYQSNIVRGLWSKGRQIRQEFAQKRAIAIADGTQCNGVPTYEAYKDLNASPFLFFDNRIEADMLTTGPDIARKAAWRRANGKLRLAFSGRLNLMKGVDDLPRVGAHLKQMGIPFEMVICGDGDYRSRLEREIARLGLEREVVLKGILEFKSELIPFISRNTDLFVCCHRQGDPSCTYLETMACGVPIVGYDNDAFAGLHRHSDTGWPTPMGRADLVAEKIRQLHDAPEELDRGARAALEFASDHTFEQTFRRRIEHLENVVNKRKSLKALR
jgi:colanic acid/amylovoran biosynthesis glycosyltransferase